MHQRSPTAERLATAAILALSTYLLVVLAFGARLGGVRLTPAGVVALCGLGALGLRSLIRRAAARRLVSAGTLLNVSILSAALLIVLLAVDLGVSAYFNLTAPATDLASLARNDKHAMVGEWYPRLYYPTAKNFRVHKPDFSLTGTHYGGFYLPAMLASPTLRDSVLDRRRLTIHINELGFRETGAIGSCETFALGDSFTFGWGVTEGATWPDLLERSLGTCVYNLGANDASPKQELLLLEYLLSRPDPPPLRRLVWLIYEGNDLEDSYAEAGPSPEPGAWAKATDGTIAVAVGVFLDRLRSQSLLERLRSGQIRLRPPGREGHGAARYTVDGVRLVTPLFHSAKFGYMLQDAPLLDRAARPEAYTTGHRHRRELNRVFARMGRLSDSLGFGVTVVIVPTSARLYAPEFHFSPEPAEPHFANYVARLARDRGFAVLDLLQELAPHARSELLYFRDDDHLNPRGHEVVAEIIAAHLRASTP